MTKAIRIAFTFFVLGLFSISCASTGKKAGAGISWEQLQSLLPNFYASHACMQRVPPNTLRKAGLVFPAFSGWPGVAPGLFEHFKGDRTTHTRLILGDSSAQGWQAVRGLTKGWRNTAVRGNRICNMIAQARKYGSDRIARVIISSNGGNDILQDYPTENLVGDFRALLKRVREIFPGAKITVVGVHPVLDGDLFERINSVNTQVAALAKSEKFCYVNPVKVLGKTEDDSLPEKYRARLDNGEIDKIHYNDAAGRLMFAAAVGCRS